MLSRKPGTVAGQHGDAEAALAREAKVIEAEYVFPYLAHAPMEPLDGFLRWDGERAVARLGSQLPDGRPPDHRRRARPQARAGAARDACWPAAASAGVRKPTMHLAPSWPQVAKAIGPGRPVKLVWTREDDMRGGYYRPLFVHRMRGACATARSWPGPTRVVGQSFIKGSPFEADDQGRRRSRHASKARTSCPTTIPNFRCDVHTADVGVPTLWWRSVGHTHTGYAVESFVDELLEAAGKDPVAGRLAMMGKAAARSRRPAAVAELARLERARAVDGRARGVAVVESFNTFVAQIAEMSVGDRRRPRCTRCGAPSIAALPSIPT